MVSLPDQLPLCPLREQVLLPGGFLHVVVGENPRSVQLAQRLFWKSSEPGGLVGVVTLRSSDGASNAPATAAGGGGAEPAPGASDEDDDDLGDGAVAPVASSSAGSSVPVAPSDPGEHQKWNAVGTAARVLKIARIRRNGEPYRFSLLMEGLCRFRISHLVQDRPYQVAAVKQLDMTDGPTPHLAAEAVDRFRSLAHQLIEMLRPRIPVISRMAGVVDTLAPELLCDVFIDAVDANREERLAILNAANLQTRYETGIKILERQLLVMRTAARIQTQLTGKESKRQRFAIERRVNNNNSNSANNGSSNTKDDSTDTVKNRVLSLVHPDGTGEEDEDDTVKRLTRRLQEACLPPDAAKVAGRELRRIKNMEKTHMIGPEHQKAVAYLEWLADLPWERSSAPLEQLDLNDARKSLDDDHFGLTKIKRRILEYIAVRWLNPSSRGSILCFVGPPGVGKTSLAKSIARTLGRSFTRISLGGVRDEADIRGFNRTYIGSRPGRIVEALKQAGTNDPVLLLDEIDKVTSAATTTGNPASALLEVLDPSQNTSFIDHYINIPIDLSKVVFIATANSKSVIPGPLLDRMEVIDLPGYMLDEKIAIGMRHLVPRQLQQHGLLPGEVEIPPTALSTLGECYTHEAGVRNLERCIAAICRAVVVRMVENGISERLPQPSASVATSPKHAADSTSGTPSAVDTEVPSRIPKVVIDDEALADILGPPRFARDDTPAQRVDGPGIVMGMAATSVGGEILFIEATKMAGTGRVRLTGRLGDVISESAHIAMAWVRSHAKELRLAEDVMTNMTQDVDLHIHFPDGAVEKDGPSAGIALVTVIVSLLSKRRVRIDTAMTGEVTLTGHVLPVGGVQAKVMAAHRKGIKRIILPLQNFEQDLDELPEAIRSSLEFLPVRRVEEVLHHAFPPVNHLPHFELQAKL